MDLPPGMVDPLFLAEMALRFQMPVAELTHGRGTPMSAHELTVFWPAYFSHLARQAERQEEKQTNTQVAV